MAYTYFASIVQNDSLCYAIDWLDVKIPAHIELKWSIGAYSNISAQLKNVENLFLLWY